MTIVEAAALYGVAETVIRKAIHATDPPFLRAKRVGRAFMVSVAALEEWWEQLPDV